MAFFFAYFATLIVERKKRMTKPELKTAIERLENGSAGFDQPFPSLFLSIFKVANKMIKVTKEKRMDESVFDGYVCGVTGNPCCGCSLYCEHRRPKDD